MAEMFLKLDGIAGESLDFAHGGEIEIRTWEWHTENHVKWDVNQGGQSTKVDVKRIDLKKVCDKASVTLYQCCVTGRHIKNGTITCRKNDGEQKVEYLIVKMTDIMIAQIDWSGMGEQQVLEENIALSFAEFKLDYKVQNDTGTADGTTSFGFNVQTQKTI
jgi:type VI secretion system secreted protein Hcp